MKEFETRQAQQEFQNWCAPDWHWGFRLGRGRMLSQCNATYAIQGNNCFKLETHKRIPHTQLQELTKAQGFLPPRVLSRAKNSRSSSMGIHRALSRLWPRLAGRSADQAGNQTPTDRIPPELSRWRLQKISPSTAQHDIQWNDVDQNALTGVTQAVKEELEQCGCPAGPLSDFCRLPRLPRLLRF